MMHTRPPADADRPRVDRPERRRLAQRRYRRRIDNGRSVVQVEVNAEIVEMLVTSRWLTESDCDDRKKIGAALGAMVTEAAKR